MHYVIIGAGYAGISCAQEIRAKDADAKITILSREQFCSRPNLFFRFKFLTWHERHLDYYGGLQVHGDSSFADKHKIEILLDVNVENINPYERTLHYKKNDELVSLQYDKLCLATGGSPSVVSFPVTVDDSTHTNVLTTTHEESAHYVDDIKNMFVVRNVEEITLLYEKMKLLYESNSHEQTDTDILVVGSGALALDVVGTIMEGYQLLNTPTKTDDKEIVWDIQNPNALPRVTILCRKNMIALPLLQDKEACTMITDRVTAPDSFYAKYLSVLRNDAVEAVLVKQVGDEKVVCGVQTKSGRVVKCSIILQAVGVNCNTTLAQQTGLMIGPKGGIVVDEQFQCKAIQGGTEIPKDTLFAAGDCAELLFVDKHCPSFVGGLDYLRHEQEDSSVVWKNWTSAREQAIQCGRSMTAQAEQVGSTVWFNQTTKLFGLYVACLGIYHFEENIGKVVVRKRVDKTINRYHKLVFLTEADQYRLIGALIIGPEMEDFRVGGSVLGAMRLDTPVPQAVMEKLLELKAVKWAGVMKAMKDVKEGKATWDEQVVSKIISEETSTAPKKFVNPLAKKKAAVKDDK
jgi:NADPH-dependent 2,4-dienoyl-CoA reductase/sulfur reductase-like enzyme